MFGGCAPSTTPPSNKPSNQQLIHGCGVHVDATRDQAERLRVEDRTHRDLPTFACGMNLDIAAILLGSFQAARAQAHHKSSSLESTKVIFL